MTRRQITTRLVIVAVAAAAIIALIRSHKSSAGEEEEITTDVAVHVGTVSRATLRRYVTAYGTVEPVPPGDGQPAAGADLSAAVGGILTEINCTEGQRVERGALLFRLDTRLAEVAVANAEKALRFAQETYERQQKLLAADATSEKAFQEAELQLSAARNELATAKTELSLLEIRAPLAGTVVGIKARLGQTVEPNTVLAQIVDLDRLVVTAQVPSREAGLLKPGQPVDFGLASPATGSGSESPESSATSPGEGSLGAPADSGGSAAAATSPSSATPPTPPSGELIVVGKDIDPATDTVLIRTSLPAGSAFQPGQFLVIRVVCEEHTSVLAVPEESIVTDPEGGPMLMMVEGDRAIPRPVKTGLRDGGLAEVAGEGLKEGMVIVTTDAYNITVETKIHVVGSE
jgi:membrane fusion protein (multidrug efflux system)